MNILKDHNWMPWRFRTPPPDCWDKEETRIRFFKYPIISGLFFSFFFSYVRQTVPRMNEDFLLRKIFSRKVELYFNGRLVCLLAYFRHWFIIRQFGELAFQISILVANISLFSSLPPLPPPPPFFGNTGFSSEVDNTLLL